MEEIKKINQNCMRYSPKLDKGFKAFPSVSEGLVARGGVRLGPL